MMKRLLIIGLAFFQLAHGQSLDILRIQYEKDIAASQRFYDSLRPGSKLKLSYRDSIFSARLMAAHILPTNDAVSLVRSLNPSLTNYSYYDSAHIVLPILPPMKNRVRRQLRRSLRRDMRANPQFQAIFSLQLDSLVAIRNTLNDSACRDLKDEKLLNRLVELDRKKVKKGQIISSYIEELMDQLIDQYRVLRNASPNNRTTTIENIGFLKKLIINFLPVTDSSYITTSFGGVSWKSSRQIHHTGLMASTNFKNFSWINFADSAISTHGGNGKAPVVFYVYDSTSVRSPDNILTDTIMQRKYIVSWRLPCKAAATQSATRASAVRTFLPIVDYYISASQDGKTWKMEDRIDLQEYFTEQPWKDIKGISPYAILINIHSIRN